MLKTFEKTKFFLPMMKIKTIFAIGILAILSSFSAIGVAPELVLYMPFEEGAGDKVKDMSGKGNDGEIVDAEWTNDGKFGKALKFNGTSSQVIIQSSASLQPDDSDFTIEAWINGDPGSQDWARIVDKFYGTGYCLGKVGAELVIGSEFGGNPNNFGSITAVFDNNWHHVAVIRDIKDVEGDKLSFLYIYVDGNMESKTIAPNINLHNQDTTPVRIGAGDECCEEGPPEGVAYFFKGIIDEVAIYRKALSEDELKQDMSKGIAIAVNSLTRLAVTWSEIRSSR